MDPTPTPPTDAPGASKKTFRSPLRVALALFLLAPPIVYAGLVLRHAYNLPFVDDYAVILGFLSGLRDSSGWSQSFDLFWQQHNEHRILLTRLAVLLQSWLTGSVDFRTLIFVGNAGWFCTAFLWCRAARHRLGFPWAAVLPIPALLFAPVHYESMLWAMASLQTYWGVFLSLACLWALAAQSYRGALGLFPAALLTSGGGAVLYPIGNLLLLLRRQWRALAWFGVLSSIVIGVYFVGYQRVANHPDPALAARLPLRMAGYFIAFLGSISSSPGLARLIGVLVGAGLLAVLLARSADVFLRLTAGFILLTGLTAAVSRSGFGADQALSSRYSVFSLLALVCIYAAGAAGMTSAPRPGWRRYWIPLWCAGSVLVWAGTTWSFEYRNVCRRFEANVLTQFNLVEKSYPSYAHITGFLRAANRQGFYDDGAAHRTARRLPPAAIASSALGDNDEFRGHLDVYDGRYLNGWAFIPRLNANSASVFVLLRSGETTFQLVPIPGVRHDVTAANNDGFDYDACGFHLFLPIYAVPPGDYALGIEVVNGPSLAVFWSDQRYRAP